jgi:hypothetical protein
MDTVALIVCLNQFEVDCGRPEGQKELLWKMNGIRIFEINTRVMTTKLTLTVEKQVILKAKFYAKQTGRSLSELIESYLESLVLEQAATKQISPRLKKLVGRVKLPKNFDEKKALRSYLEKKHL